MFIAFEGLDGSGKSTVAERLVQAMSAAGLDAILTREPGGTRVGEHIRSMLLSDESPTIVPRAEALLFAAARAQLVDQVIRPALERGAVVVTDRFTDSSLAYQWGGRGLDKEGIGAVQRMATAGLEPDVKILLDIPVETALRRRLSDTGEVNRLDKEALEFHARVRDAYHWLAEADPGRWRVVDASRSEDDVWADVSRTVNLSGLSASRDRWPREEPNQKVVG
ncbi:MAG: dTMP kinase [Chloroflexi bacterium]|nr:dTMP kinase [Chloroflexota bacterium]